MKKFFLRHLDLFLYLFMVLVFFWELYFSYSSAVGLDLNSDTYDVGVFFGMFLLSFLFFVGHVFGSFICYLSRKRRQVRADLVVTDKEA